MPSFPPVILLVHFLLLSASICNASPINRQVGISDNVFMTTQNGTDGLEQRVCSIDAVTYRDGETIPTSSPCEHCVCRPPGFACTITSCEYRPGCKAFRRSDQCCPEYQCECEKDGKIYQNGDKIVDNNNPCEVCYCQGGEIICAVIDCYWRNDCPPRYIDNRCCPMYDHCPPPAAQGPIRHRLPVLTSPIPISWHNLTQSLSTSTPPPPPPPQASSSAPEVATSTITTTTTTTEAVTEPSSSTTTSTTASTTTTTTSAPSSSVPLVNDDEPSPTSPASVSTAATDSEIPAAEPEPEPQSDINPEPVDISESVKVNDELLASADPAVPIPTTTQPDLESSLADEQQTTSIPLKDEVESDDNQGAATEALPLLDQVNPTQVTREHQDSTPAHLVSASSSDTGSQVISEPTAAAVFPGLYDDNTAATTSQSVSNDDNVISLDDEVPSATTVASLLGEIAHDDNTGSDDDGNNDNGAGATEQQTFDVTERLVANQEEIHNDNSAIPLDDATEKVVNDSPTESLPVSLADDVQQPESVTEKAIFDDGQDDDVVSSAAATTVASQDQVSIDEDRPQANPDELVRNDLFEATTQPSAVDVHVHQNDDEQADISSSSLPATTFATPSLQVGNEELVYADSGAVDVTTEQQILLNDEAQEIGAVTAASSVVPAVVGNDIVNDSPATTALPNEILDDQPETVTQSDSLLPSINTAQDKNVETLDSLHQVNNDDAISATELPLLDAPSNIATEERQVLEVEINTTPSLQNGIQDDESTAVTEQSVHQDDDDGEFIQHDDSAVEEQAVTQVSHDDLNDEAVPTATERIINDDAAQATENSLVSQDDEPAPSTGQPQQYNDDAAAAVTPTERIQAYHYDEQSEQQQVTEALPVSQNDDDSVEILADEPVTQQTSLSQERIVEKVVAAEVISQDAPAATQAPSSDDSNNIDVFDIILDDEAIPSEPETLNQLRDNHFSQSDMSSLLEAVRNADHLENLRISTGVALPVETTVSPSQSDDIVDEAIVVREDVDQEALHDSAAAATTQANDLQVEVALNDKEEPAQQPTEVPPSSSVPLQDDNQETQTQRQFRDDIEEMLEFRHHINGEPHGDEEQVSTTIIVPIQQQARDDAVTTSSPSAADETDAVFDDEPVVATTAHPNEYRNKVHKVAQVLAQHNVIPGSDEDFSSGSKFRLEPDVFGGASLEGQVDEQADQNEVTTVHAQFLSHDQAETTVAPSLDLARFDPDILADVVSEAAVTELPTVEIVHDNVEVSTARVFADDAITESNNLIQNDDTQDDEQVAATTVSSSRAEQLIINVDSLADAASEGSGHHDASSETEAPLQFDATEASGQARLDLEELFTVDQTTLPAVLHDDESSGVEVTSSPSSYSFRAEILSSLEDDTADDGGSGNGPVQQDAAVVISGVTNSPGNVDVLRSEPVASVTEPQEVVVNDEQAIQTTAKYVEELVQDDEVAAPTTESLVSRFRTDLEIETEAPPASSSPPAVEQQQNDFVEVSTGTPSGFAVEFKENDDAVPTQTPVPEIHEVSNDEAAGLNQAPDIIPDDDETATPANIPVLNLVASNDEPAVTQASAGQVVVEHVSQDEQELIAHDEVATQASEVVHISQDEQEVIAHDQAATPSSIIHDDIDSVTGASFRSEIISDDEVVTPANDEPVTQGAVQEIVNNDQETVTQAGETLASNDDATVFPLLDQHHDGVNEEVATSPSSVLNDESATLAAAVVVENEQVQNQDDSIVFSDEPIPTTFQPVDRLRSGSIVDSSEQQTEPANSIQNDGTTEAIVNDDISVVTTIATPASPVISEGQQSVNNTNNASSSSIFSASKVVSRNEEMILPRIQPISPEIGRNNPHGLRFDFALPPEKDNSWLSRAVNQFRRLTGFNSISSSSSSSNNNIDNRPAAGSSSRTNRLTRFPSRRFLLF